MRFYDAMDRCTNNRVDLDVLVDLVQQQIEDGGYATAVENAQRLIECRHEKGKALYTVASRKPQRANPAPSPTSAAAAAVTLAPAAFQLRCTAVSNYILLNWNSLFIGAAYTIYRRVNNGSWHVIGTTNDVHSFDNSASGGTTYTYYITATNGSRMETSWEALPLP